MALRRHARQSRGAGFFRAASAAPTLLAAGALILLGAASGGAQTLLTDSSAGPIRLEQVAEFDHPWGMDFLPNGDVVVTERNGRLFLVSPTAEEGARRTEISGAPEVYDQGQGGLLDVALSPDFAETGLLYLSYAQPAPEGARTAVDRAVLLRDGAPRLIERETIFVQRPALASRRHFGSRIVIAPDGLLFITLGDRGAREQAQATDGLLGKIVRIAPDGAIPADNPFIDVESYAPEIWSLGHRNVQGAALNPSDGALWTVEHGARGGDELNRPLAGLNYGWPIISYGVHYSGQQIGVGAAAPGYEQPVYYWDPSIAPSGLAFYEGDLFPQWRGDALVGALKYRLVARLDVEDGAIVGEERLFDDQIGRIRDVAVGPDGAIWLLTDEGRGGLWRATPG